MATQEEKAHILLVLSVSHYPLTVYLFRYNHTVSFSCFLFCLFVPYCVGVVGVFSYCCYPISLLTCNFWCQGLSPAPNTLLIFLSHSHSTFLTCNTKSPFPSFLLFLWHCHEPFHCDHVSLAAQEGNGTVDQANSGIPHSTTHTHTHTPYTFSLSLSLSLSA